MDIHSTVELHTGRTMPMLGLGTWELTEGTSRAVEQAVALGYRMIDTSGDYGTQPGVGRALKNGIGRDNIFLVTKIEEDEDAYEATRRNLDELGEEYVNLMLIHRPPENGAGVHLWEGLIRARDEGMARDIGVSNYSIAEMRELHKTTGELPTVNQIEWSPFGWSREMLQWSRDNGVVLQAYSPLTRGERLDDEVLREIAERHDATPAQVLLRWDLHCGVVPIPKAGQFEHMAENLGAFDVDLTDEEFERLDALDEKWSALGERPEYMDDASEE